MNVKDQMIIARWIGEADKSGRTNANLPSIGRTDGGPRGEREHLSWQQDSTHNAIALGNQYDRGEMRHLVGTFHAFCGPYMTRGWRGMGHPNV